MLCLHTLSREARQIIVTGRVQGVGYRPFVYVTAHELGLTGSVLNGSGKVFIHAEGEPADIDRLEHALVHAAPPLARPGLASSERVKMIGARTFEILASDSTTEPEIHVPPDLYTCDDCVKELTNPEERRFGYPFINCTQCGPRYTIITAMPYDRPNTSMAGFPLCDDCGAEYSNPRDRRFHAQPLACPACGPQLLFVSLAESEQLEVQTKEESGTPLPDHNAPGARYERTGMCSSVSGKGVPDSSDQPGTNDAKSQIRKVIQSLEAGQIVAVKGVGGYHLVCDAANDAAVQTLRDRKRRPDKPLAVMFPIEGADGLDAMRASLDLDAVSAEAIIDPARPIVLARKRTDFPLSERLAPGLGELGVFLPYSPLHHELLRAFGKPIVATSGNISGEPVITDNAEALSRLSGIADAFLHHDRPIVRPADDPVIRPMAGAARVIRLGRGLAPLERSLAQRLARPVLATGGHMKNTVAIGWDRRVVISPHVGDLDSPRSNDIFQQVISDIQNLYNVKSYVIACDLHPGYTSSRWAEQQGLSLVRVQHHAAHASSLAGEHADIERWLVFTWDGVGYGQDGTLWGGEALVGAPGSWTRAASFRPFHLVGGDKAGREPWRSAAALLWAEDREFVAAGLQQQATRPASEITLAHQAWKRGFGVFETSAVGRLFDAAAAMILGRDDASFEGQGPMELEHAAVYGCQPVPLPLALDDSRVLRSDWAPLVDVLSDRNVSAGTRAGIFHESMAQALVDQALHVRETMHFDAVGLSGGVFQNRKLTESVIERLGTENIEVRVHREIPANDGGLCFGQIIEAAALGSA